jgi:hypothetical protein
LKGNETKVNLDLGQDIIREIVNLKVIFGKTNLMDKVHFLARMERG